MVDFVSVHARPRLPRELVKRPVSGLPGTAVRWFAWCNVRPTGFGIARIGSGSLPSPVDAATPAASTGDGLVAGQPEHRDDLVTDDADLGDQFLDDGFALRAVGGWTSSMLGRKPESNGG
ncbi:hypothetical protein [Actinoplanes cyaneus]|uniref:hypothetical protein n=1 Tax=Actinoplanes cyaneus TaxID=52696 RepID=UPI0019414A75|nr:hypothetical protein [Actinoplanes cyaneus]